MEDDLDSKFIYDININIWLVTITEINKINGFPFFHLHILQSISSFVIEINVNFYKYNIYWQGGSTCVPNSCVNIPFLFSFLLNYTTYYYTCQQLLFYKAKHIVFSASEWLGSSSSDWTSQWRGRVRLWNLGKSEQWGRGEEHLPWRCSGQGGTSQEWRSFTSSWRCPTLGHGSSAGSI